VAQSACHCSAERLCGANSAALAAATSVNGSMFPPAVALPPTQHAAGFVDRAQGLGSYDEERNSTSGKNSYHEVLRRAAAHEVGADEPDERPAP